VEVLVKKISWRKKREEQAVEKFGEREEFLLVLEQTVEKFGEREELLAGNTNK